jgi:acyl carrier protein
MSVHIAVLREIWCDALALDEVASNADFFAAGGDSLAAMKIVAEIERRLGADVSLRELYAAASLSELSALVAGRVSRTADPPAIPAVGAATTAGRARASLGQEWQLHLEEHPSQAGIDPFLINYAVRLRGSVDLDRLQKALDLLVDRHSMLRTSFHRVRDTVELRPEPDARLVLQELRIGSGFLSASAAREIAEQPFDRRRPPLARCLFLTFSPSEHLLMLVLDHIIADGSSLRILMRDLVEAYQRLESDADAVLDPAGMTFGEWAAAQRQGLEGDGMAEIEQYWRTTLGPDAAVVIAPFRDYRQPARIQPDGRMHTLEPAASAWIRGVAARHGVTVFALLCAAFLAGARASLTHGEFCVVTTLSNRGPESAETVGPLAHDVFLRLSVPDDPDIVSLAHQIQRRTAEAHEFGRLPSSHVAALLWPAAGVELFDQPAIYFSANQEWVGAFALGDAVSSSAPSAPDVTMPGVECVVIDRGERLAVDMRYPAGSFRGAGPAEFLARGMALLRETEPYSEQTRSAHLTSGGARFS